MTHAELMTLVNEGKVKFHHAGSERGYLWVRHDNRVCAYEGKFGKGYKVSRANLRSGVHGFHSNNFYAVEYYIFTK